MVIGVGKIGMDVVFHLFSEGVDFDVIIWIVSNDVWFVNWVTIMLKVIVDAMFD